MWRGRKRHNFVVVDDKGVSKLCSMKPSVASLLWRHVTVLLSRLLSDWEAGMDFYFTYFLSTERPGI